MATGIKRTSIILRTIIIAASLLFLTGASCFFSENIPFEKAMVTLRFDDAYASQKDMCALADSLDLKTTVYSIPEFVGKGPYMTWEDLIGFYRRGHEIGSHGLTHARLSLLGRERFEKEVLGSALALRQRGIDARSFAYPYGSTNPLFDSIIRKEYEAAAIYPRFSPGSPNEGDTDPYRINCVESPSLAELRIMLDEVVKKRLWLVLCHHAMGYDGGKFTTTPEEVGANIRVIADYRDRGLLDVVTIRQGSARLRAK